MRYCMMKGIKLSLFLINDTLHGARYFQNTGEGLEGTVKQ